MMSAKRIAISQRYSGWPRSVTWQLPPSFTTVRAAFALGFTSPAQCAHRSCGEYAVALRRARPLVDTDVVWLTFHTGKPAAHVWVTLLRVWGRHPETSGGSARAKSRGRYCSKAIHCCTKMRSRYELGRRAEPSARLNRIAVDSTSPLGCIPIEASEGELTVAPGPGAT